MARRAERIVLDTNVLVSALAFGGGPRTVLQLGRKGVLTVFASPFILRELKAVLASRKVGWSADRIADAEGDLRSFVRLVEPGIRINVIRARHQDNRILECAAEAKADSIVTGNLRHIRPLGSFQGIAIHTPREFLEAYFPGL